MSESSHGLSDELDPAPVDDSQVVFDGAVWDIKRDSFAFGDQTLVREYLDHPGAVAILALDDDDNVVLIKQYRHPVRTLSWEIPAGLLDVAGEDPLAAAQRELAEEADLAATDWSVLAEFFTTPGSSNEAIRIYLARGLETTGETFDRTGEESGMETRRVPLDQAVDAVLARRIQNPSLAVGVLAAQVARSRGWRSLGTADESWPQRPSQPRPGDPGH